MIIETSKVHTVLNLEDPEIRKGILSTLEFIGRTCYKSQDKITEDSASKFVRGLVKRGHEAMLEHVSLTVLFTVDRGISHEIVRHRMASFAQESTRYCNYSQDKFGKEITVIQPFYLKVGTPAWTAWYDSCKKAEESYFAMLAEGCMPEEARAVLPMSLKTEIWMTANLREWRHFLKLRAAGVTGKPHPQMLEVALPLLEVLRKSLPEVFDDIPVPAIMPKETDEKKDGDA